MGLISKLKKLDNARRVSVISYYFKLQARLYDFSCLGGRGKEVVCRGDSSRSDCPLAFYFAIPKVRFTFSYKAMIGAGVGISIIGFRRDWLQ